MKDVLQALGGERLRQAARWPRLRGPHRGSDDPYDGTMDQQIEGLTFRLEQE
jgi:hypothetical protein